MKCCVPLCGITGSNYPPTFLANHKRVTFHEFPSRAVLWLRKSWLTMVGIRECDLPRDAVVCSQHFMKNDFLVSKPDTVQLKRNSIPSVFRVSHFECSNFCVTCLDTGGSKLYVLDKNYLARAFTNVTGLSVSLLRDRINTVPKLCPECAQRLTNCDAFKDKALRANTVLLDLRQKRRIITGDGLKSVNRLGNLLTSNLVKHTFTPDHYDLHLVHNEEDDNTQQKDNILCNSEENNDVKSEKSDETRYKSDKDATDCEIEYLSELDDIYNKGEKLDAYVNENNDTFKFEVNISDMNDDIINNDNIRKRQNISKYKLYDDANIIISDFNATDNEEFLGNYRDHHNDTDNTYDGDNDIDEDIAHDDDIKDDKDFDFDINDDIHELSDDDSKNMILKALKGGSNSENKVSLNNVIFVKDPRPMIQHEDSISRKDTTILYNYLQRVNNDIKCKSETNEQAIDKILTQRNQTAMSNNNNIIVEHNNEINDQNENQIIMNEQKGYVVLNSDDVPPSMLKDIQDGKIIIEIEKKSEQNKKRKKFRREVKFNTTKINFVNERLAVFGKRIRFWDKDPPMKHIPRPKTRDCTKENLKSFTKTWLTYEEQMAEFQKRKDTAEYQRAKYKCETCFKPFWQPDAYQRHLEKHTDKFGPLSCATCGLRFRIKNYLRKHILAVHTHRYNCKQCDFTTLHNAVAINHQRWHSGYKYVCEICGAEYGRKSSWFSHMRIMHPSDYACALCGFSFVSPKGVAYHMNLAHPFQDKQNLSGPSCEDCDIRFASDAAYQQHLQVSPKHAVGGRKRKRNEPIPSHSGPRKRVRPSASVLCDLCGKSFASAAHLRYHMHVHTGEKAHECEICHKRFAMSCSLRSHMALRHSANPPRYPCGVCHKDFATVSSRLKHMARHQESRPLAKCDLCDKTFATVCSRNQHVSHVHLNVPWPKRNRPDRQSQDTDR